MQGMTPLMSGAAALAARTERPLCTQRRRGREIVRGAAGSETYVPLSRLLAFDLLETKPSLDETITFARGQ
jgi:hypothetical protein